MYSVLRCSNSSNAVLHRFLLIGHCFLSQDSQAALEGRAIVNLQMSNTFAAFVDMNDCLKV